MITYNFLFSGVKYALINCGLTVIVMSLSFWIFIALLITLAKLQANESPKLLDALRAPKSVFWRVLRVIIGYSLLPLIPLLVGAAIMGRLAMNPLFQTMLGQLSQPGFGGNESLNFLLLVQLVILLTLIPVMFLAVIFLFAPLIAAVEDHSTRAFAGSIGLIRGRFWRVSGGLLLAIALFQSVPLVVILIKQLRFSATAIYLTGLSVAFCNLFIYPFGVAFMTKLYFELKETKEEHKVRVSQIGVSG